MPLGYYISQSERDVYCPFVIVCAAAYSCICLHLGVLKIMRQCTAVEESDHMRIALLLMYACILFINTEDGICM